MCLGVCTLSFAISDTQEPSEVQHYDRADLLLQKYEAEHGKVDLSGKAGGGKGPQEEYEDTVAQHGDRGFAEFTERIQRYPTQCLRRVLRPPFFPFRHFTRNMTRLLVACPAFCVIRSVILSQESKYFLCICTNDWPLFSI
jgi:hypothetical protein